jgi:hypothetical protein
MKFTKELVAFANTLIKERGITRSLAYKAAFIRFSARFEAFVEALNEGQTKVFYKADKHQSEIQGRFALSMREAIERGEYVPKGTDKKMPHLFTYFDMERGEPRKFKIWNFVGFAK